MTRISLNSPLLILSIVLLIFASFAFFNTKIHMALREFWAAPEREILSVVTGKIFPNGTGTVIKVATPNSLQLEIFEEIESQQKLVDKIDLPGLRDAYMQFMARSTNLALKDMDRDSTYEIVAPTYSHNLQPILNIFKYNPETRRFEPYIQ